MEKVKVTIDGKVIEVPADYTVLKACTEAGIKVPTLCYLEKINEIGACRMCLVEIEGVRGMVASCVFPVNDGMVVKTNSPKIREARRVNLELILSTHERECTTCIRSENCELQSLSKELNITNLDFQGETKVKEIDDLSPSIMRNNNKCILCRRCISACKEMQRITAIQCTNRGYNTEIGVGFDKSMNDFNCIGCGQCIVACPVAALTENSNIEEVWKAIADKDTVTIAQVAPSVRIALGEEFGQEIGVSVTKKMVTAIKRLGFDYVVDTNVGADFTIMEEASELMERVKNGTGKLPLLTSCCPAWIKTCEQDYPDLIPNLSSCKSPQGMLSSILKTYFAQNANIDPVKIKVVSIMPCTAKKIEKRRGELLREGIVDTDIAITSRELARMIKETGTDLLNLEDSEFDSPLGFGTGAGAIFGATGGVTEAALRTAMYFITGKEDSEIEFNAVRGQQKIKEFMLEEGDVKLKGAVVSGIGNARDVLDKVRKGESDYQFIEIMACPGGCIMGGGQPIVTSRKRSEVNVYDLRAKAIYDEDKNLPFRRSHENPYVKKVYEDFLEKPLSHKSHELLHTHYDQQEKYKWPCDCCKK